MAQTIRRTKAHDSKILKVLRNQISLKQTADPIRALLLNEVFDDPIYRDNSRSIQKAIAKKNGLSVAADLLEQAFGLTKTTEAAVQQSA